MRVKANIIHRIINNHRRVLPALVLPHLRTAQLGSPSRAVTRLWLLLQYYLPLSLLTTITSITSSVSALTYQDSVDVSFTFDPTLSISLSSNNISIDNLVPGNFAHSNTITINVSTNNVYGYTLTAKVGEDGGGTGTSASSDLVNTSSSTPFTSLSPNDRLTLSNFANNTWGYTTSTNISDTATAYTGLLYNTDTTINMTKNSTGTALGKYQGTNTTNFTIGASASTDQLSGEYANILTFTAVTNVDVPPLCNPSGTTISTISCMQDINESNKTSILASMTEDSQYQLVDSRDEKTYWVAKLKDGNVWMTQNLDHNIVTTANFYTSENTDLNEYGTNGYIDGYSCSNPDTTTNCTAEGEIIIWQPERRTINAATTMDTSISNISAYVNHGGNPYSVDPGNWYWSGTYYSSSTECPSTDTNGNLGCNYMSKPDNISWSTYFSTTPFTGAGTSNNGTHGHVGNYYNWTASIASNNSSSYTSSTLNNTSANPSNSICPAGWRLPVITTYTSSVPYAPGTNEFYNIVYYYNSGTRSSDANLLAYPLYFIRAGRIYSKALHLAGYGGDYGSSALSSSNNSAGMYFISGRIDPLNGNSRAYGRSVRCLLR